MDLPPLSDALTWLTTQDGRPVGIRLHPRGCVLALWLRETLAAAEVYVDDQVVRVRWASGWRMTVPTPREYARVIEAVDWSCGAGGAMTIHVCEAREAIERVLRETQKEHWDAWA